MSSKDTTVVHLSLNCFYRETSESFSIDLSTCISLKDALKAANSRLPTNDDCEDIAFVPWDSGVVDTKYLGFRELREFAKTNKNVEVKKSLYFYYKKLVESYSTSRVKVTQSMLSEICKYPSNFAYLADKVISCELGIHILFKISSNTWARTTDIWKLIYGIYSNSSCVLDESDIKILYNRFSDLNSPIDVIKTFDIYLLSTEDILNHTVATDLRRLVGDRLPYDRDPIPIISVMNTSATKFLSQKDNEAIQLFYNNTTFAEMNNRLQKINSEYFMDKQNSKYDTEYIEELRSHLSNTQDYILNSGFYYQISIGYSENNAVHLQKLNDLQNRFSEVKYFSNNSNLSNSFHSKEGGMFLLDALVYLKIKKKGFNNYDLIETIMSFNATAAVNEKFYIYEASIEIIKSMKYLFEKLKSETKVNNNYIIGIMNPLFIEQEPFLELFSALFKAFFENWKMMKGTSDIVENIFNFTCHQIDQILLKPEVRNLDFFRDYNKQIPSYHTESHHWLKMDVGKIIAEEISINNDILKHARAHLHEPITRIISKSFLHIIKEQPFTAIKIHRNKDKRHLELSFNEEFSFKVKETREDNTVESEQSLRVFDFKKKVKSPEDIKALIDDEVVKRKINKHSILLLFKNAKILFEENENQKMRLMVLTDSLLHLSMNKMESILFKSYYAKLEYISLKVKFFELEGNSSKKPPPKVPELPKDIDDVFDNC